MLRDALIGAVAGAVGTMALDIATYSDMAIRGRPASSTPQRMIATIGQKTGIVDSEQPPETTQNRESGLGALSGYATGLVVGTAYGLLRPSMRRVPLPVAAAGVGLVAMATSDVPMTALKVTDPRTWGAAGWLSDLIPHLIYGFVTAWVVDWIGER